MAEELGRDPDPGILLGVIELLVVDNPRPDAFVDHEKRSIIGQSEQDHRRGSVVHPGGA